MSVRAKFVCCRNDEQPGTEGGCEIVLEPVVGGSDENDSFYKYTPWGQITLGVVNPAASSQFEVGKEYYVDFSPTE